MESKSSSFSKEIVLMSMASARLDEASFGTLMSSIALTSLLSALKLYVLYRTRAMRKISNRSRNSSSFFKV